MQQGLRIARNLQSYTIVMIVLITANVKNAKEHRCFPLKFKRVRPS